MKKLSLRIVVLCSLILIPAFAEESRESIPGLSGKTNFITAGAGLAFLNGNAGLAVNLGVLHELFENSSFFVGADLGLDFWSASTSMQLLPTAIMRFDMLGNQSFYPYIGVSAGPNIYMEKTPRVAGNGTDTNTQLLFELLIRPGIFTHFSKTFSLNAEAKMGILRSEFIFLPQVNLAVSI